MRIVNRRKTKVDKKPEAAVLGVGPRLCRLGC